MSPNDTNFGYTMPKASGPGNDPLADSLDLGQTVRLPATGTLIFGRYRLQRVLGRGGMGLVWLAVDTKLERTVALKFLPDIIGANSAAVRDLKDETRRGLELAHPNIVRIYDFVDDEQAAAISMEFVDGKSLLESRMAQPHKVFSPEELGPWIGQLCDALDYAHIQRRIVHRDLKPANLMVNSELQLKIADFGIACSVSESMSRLSVHNANTSGTLLYMSPQQLMGDHPRPTDDIYSVGATLYELLAGKPPFYGGDITCQITGKAAPSVRQRREELEIAATDISAEWEGVIASCLDKAPERRPQTAGDLARRLGVALKAESHTRTSTVSTIRSTSLNPLEVPAARKSLDSGAVPGLAKKPFVARPVMMGVGVLLLLLLLGVGLRWWTTRAGEWGLQTDPRDATVSLAGRTLITPAVFTDLKPGSYQASITHEGYEPKVINFTLAPGQKVNVSGVSLLPSAGLVLLSSVPEGVKFEIRPTDSAKVEMVTGETPKKFALPPGRYEVTMKHDGELKTADFVLSRGADVIQSFNFNAEPPPTTTFATSREAPIPVPLPPQMRGSTSSAPIVNAPGDAADAAQMAAAPAPAALTAEHKITPPGSSKTSSTNMAGWEMVEYQKRDYISANSIHRFYRFADLNVKGDDIVFRSPVIIMRATAGSQELFINNVKFVMSFPVVELNGKMCISRLDLCKLIDPVLRPSYIGTSRFDTVILDAGHGGADSGARGIYGYEKDFTLKLASKVKAILEKQGLKVVLTRSTDTLISTIERVAMANKIPDSIYVSLHFNSGDSSASGIETSTVSSQESASTDGRDGEATASQNDHRDSENIALATAIHASVIHRFKLVDRGVKRAELDDLEGLQGPGVLFEGGFITHEGDGKLIAAPDFQDELASTIGLAIKNFFRALKPKK